ncbi:MAG: AAA family ATPase, partial [Lachnospiraceae bacterium]|nr:AAA family ATPase [Lachnospiraceae bacterium]
MQILDIHIGSFGGIQNMKLSFEDGFQIIYGENGYGKSTIMSFIRLMLYGKNSKSRDLNQNLRKKYTPFNGSKMNGSMRWEINGHSIRIDREFGKTQANDIIYVFNETTGTELPVPAGMEIGEYLLNMNEKIFEKVIFGGSPDGDMGTAAGDIMSGLVNMGTSGDEEISVSDILADLNTAMENLKSKRGTSGSIPRISEEIARMNEEKSALSQRKKELEQIRRSDISMADKEKTLLGNLIARLENERYTTERQRRKKTKGEKTEVNKRKRGRYFIPAVLCFLFGIFLIGNGNGIFESAGYRYTAALILFLAGTGFLTVAGRKSHLPEAEEDFTEYSEKISELLDDLGYNGYSLDDLKERLWEL